MPTPEQIATFTPDQRRAYEGLKDLFHWSLPDLESIPLEILETIFLTRMQALPIERLVFSGGGAKGVVYTGAYRAMVDTGAMKSVMEVSGSSVGSVPATLIAVGNNPDDVRRLFENDLSVLLGKRVGSFFRSNSPGTMFMSKSTVHGYNLVRDQVIKAITDYFDSIQDKADFIALYPEVQQILTKVTKVDGKFPVRVVDDIEVTEPPTITFADLDILHSINPNRFKKLFMTATNLGSCRLHIFSAHTTPKVEIALAVCASCCIPGFFSPVSIPVSSEDDKWIDGGVHDNMPAGYFDLDEKGNLTTNNKKAQTLLFAFAEGSESDENYVFDAIHHASKPYEISWIQWFLIDVLMPFLASLTPEFSLSERQEDIYQRMRGDYPLRTVQLNTSSIGPLSFANATLYSRVLFTLGYLDTLTYVVNHQLHDQCTAQALDVQAFRTDILRYYEPIYRAVLLGFGKNPEEDTLLNNMNERDENGSLQLTLERRLDLIKAKVLEDISSPAAFALSRALELRFGNITPEDLFKETYKESFKHCGTFSVSQVTGESIFSAQTLHQSLKNRSMFGLYNDQPKTALETRLFNVFTELSELPEFNQAYAAYGTVVETDKEQEQTAYCNMQVLGIFMATLGVAAVAVAFVALNAATLGASGLAFAITGGFSMLVGCGLFKETQNQTVFMPQLHVSLPQPG